MKIMTSINVRGKNYDLVSISPFTTMLMSRVLNEFPEIMKEDSSEMLINPNFTGVQTFLEKMFEKSGKIDFEKFYKNNKFRIKKVLEMVL